MNIHPSIVEYAVIKEFKTNTLALSHDNEQAHARKTAYLIMSEISGMSIREIARRFRKSHPGVIKMINSARHKIQSDIHFNLAYHKVIQRINNEIQLHIQGKKKRKKLYNLHYKLRQKGIKLDCYKRCIFIPHHRHEEITRQGGPQLKYLHQQGYSIQLEV